MTDDPWTSPDPQPGDFDDILLSLAAEDVTEQPGEAHASLRVLVSVEGDDAELLQRIARDRGTSPHDVVAALLRDADSRAA